MIISTKINTAGWPISYITTWNVNNTQYKWRLTILQVDELPVPASVKMLFLNDASDWAWGK